MSRQKPERSGLETYRSAGIQLDGRQRMQGRRRIRRCSTPNHRPLRLSATRFGATTDAGRWQSVMLSGGEHRFSLLRGETRVSTADRGGTLREWKAQPRSYAAPSPQFPLALPKAMPKLASHFELDQTQHRAAEGTSMTMAHRPAIIQRCVIAPSSTIEPQAWLDGALAHYVRRFRQ